MKIQLALLLAVAATLPTLAHAGKGGGSGVASKNNAHSGAVEDRSPVNVPAPAGKGVSSDPSILYLQDVKPVEIYEHHADMPEKQFSYGIIKILGARQGVSVAFYTGRREGRLDGHFCNVVPGATSTSSCGWTAWITDSPGGRPLCATYPDGNGVGSALGAWVLGGQVTVAKLNELAGQTNGAVKLGRDTCTLQPHKKYYCNITAQAWDGDKFTVNLKPGWGGLTCVGLKASSPFDTFEMADINQAAHPIGL